MKTLFGWLKGRFISGMLLLFPAVIAVSVTFQIFRYVYRMMRFSIALIPPRFGHLPYIDRITPVVAFFAFIFIIWILGAFVKTYIGKMLRGRAHSIISSIPFAGALFHAFRQLMDIAFSKSPRTFSRVVLVDFPSPGSKAIGFITGEASEQVLRHRGIPDFHKEHYKVFIPATPNPASGFLLILPKKEVIMTDLSVEEGLLRVVSGGILKQTTGIGGSPKKQEDRP
jgi:uncharacterized membrane protein